MARFLKDRSKKIGTAPGSAMFIGEKKVEQTTIHLMDYTHKQILEKNYTEVESLAGLDQTETFSWLDVCGLHNEKIISEIGHLFGFHNLLIEDILNTGQRPTFVDYDDYFYVSVKMLKYDKETDYVQSEQLNIVVGKNYLFTFQEEPGDVFNPIRERLRKEGVKKVQRRCKDKSPWC